MAKNNPTANHVLLGRMSGYFSPSSPAHWADLGCGSGVFTEVLADLLPMGSRITVIDKDQQDLVGKMGADIPVLFKKADFVADELHIAPVDGILMANVLHFVKDKEVLIHKLELLFKADPQFLIVEYDRFSPNPWEIGRAHV